MIDLEQSAKATTAAEVKEPVSETSPTKSDTADPATPIATSFTTANGDGLTFDPQNLLSIFDEVALIEAEE